ncbi:MAG: hypothetical protein R3C28_24015 [Pirellulaceae bacterium]
MVRLKTQKERIAKRDANSPTPALTDVANGANPAAPSEQTNTAATEDEQKQLNQRIDTLENGFRSSR